MLQLEQKIEKVKTKITLVQQRQLSSFLGQQSPPRVASEQGGVDSRLSPSSMCYNPEQTYTASLQMATTELAGGRAQTSA